MINQNFIPYRQSRLEINLAKKKKKNEAANDRRTFNNGVTNQMDLVADKLNGLVAKCDDDDDDEHVALWSIDMIISLTLNGGN